MALQIKALEDFKYDRDEFKKDDIRTHDQGELFVQLGWAEAVDGSVTTGDRKPGVSELDVQNSIVGA